MAAPVMAEVLQTVAVAVATEEAATVEAAIAAGLLPQMDADLRHHHQMVEAAAGEAVHAARVTAAATDAGLAVAGVAAAVPAAVAALAEVAAAVARDLLLPTEAVIAVVDKGVLPAGVTAPLTGRTRCCISNTKNRTRSYSLFFSFLKIYNP